MNYSREIEIKMSNGSIIKQFFPTVVTYKGEKDAIEKIKLDLDKEISSRCDDVTKIEEIKVYNIFYTASESLFFVESLKLNNKKYNLTKIPEFIKSKEIESIPFPEFYEKFPELKALFCLR